VGFRPFVFNLARGLGLSGHVANTSTGVVIEVEGSNARLEEFLTRLNSDAPPIAVVTEVRTESLPLRGDREFVIRPSDDAAAVATLISPDVAVCEDCLSELFDPQDRRYRYPFINCTNCGPRYTIIENIPYDRPFTSMRHFTMCPKCQAEYDDPTDRRFHAQPNACPECGPRVSLYDAGQTPFTTDDPIRTTAELLRGGSVVAIKGLGGFHLAVDATNDEAVRELRRRKGREEKPLAVMVPDLATVQALCHLTDPERAVLTAPQAPIVLLRKRPGNPLAEAVAPGNDRFGVMLPYTPLHHLLLRQGFTALVMTSANYSEEPICIDNREAFQRLGRIADYFLVHDRDIYLRSDDSVVIHLAGELRPIRRSRGFVPLPVFVASDGPPVLAVGGELKNTVCLLKGKHAILSQHIGDLENLEAYRFFQLTVEHLQRIFETTPELIVYDAHPRYLATQWAREQQAIPVHPVQHHHAHLAACLAENHVDEPTIGLIMDGTGYGSDGTIWGGEVLIGDFRSFQRFAHFEPFPLPGGDAAIKAPWRTAVSYLFQTFGPDLPDLPFLQEHDPDPIVEIVTKRVNTPLTSSCGRLFDAVAALCGGRQTIRYEAQAAIEFMQQARGLDVRPFDYILDRKNDHWEILVAPIIRSAVRFLQAGEPLGKLSSRFHKTLIEVFVEVACQARNETGIRRVALSGGVFQNQLLFEALLPALERRGFQVLTHTQVPTNDGGLALGQAVIGRQYRRDHPSE
jgi:hydrogenase maturation protein HypF